MSLPLEGHVSLVTGSSTGIGRALALMLAEQGSTVVLVARDADRLQQAKDAITQQVAGARVLACPADVTDDQQLAGVFDQIDQQCGRLDILINNAAAFDGGPIDELPLASFDKVLNVSLRAAFAATQLAFRRMKTSGQGRIINVGSISGKRVRVNTVAYATAKFGLVGLTEATALEGRPFGITCGVVHPGNVRVERRHTDHPDDQEPMVEPDAVVQVVKAMVLLPPDAVVLEATVVPRDQLYMGRG